VLHRTVSIGDNVPLYLLKMAYDIDEIPFYDKHSNLIGNIFRFLYNICPRVQTDGLGPHFSEILDVA
jgi:hypothetical protein